MVIDIPKLIEQSATAATGVEFSAEFQKQIEQSVEQQVAANQAALKAMAARVTREAAARPAAEGTAVGMAGGKLEVAVKKDGRLLGRANATLNMDRTMRAVLALARRDQGEIPFALDRTGALYTPDPGDKARLDAMDAAKAAAGATTAGPRRVGEWIIVARKDPSGITFGIARPVGESLREIRRAPVRNLSLGLLVIGIAFIGIVEAHVSEFRGKAELFDDATMMALRIG